MLSRPPSRSRELFRNRATKQTSLWRALNKLTVNRLATGTPYRRAKRTPGEHPFVRAPAEPILPSRPMHWMSRRAERRSRTAAVQRPPAGLVLDGREHDGRMVGAGAVLARRQARCLNRQLSLPVSTISQWWVRRSRSAVVILASPKTLGHSAKARFVVTTMDVRS